jgi:hypothetical protein
MQSKTLKGTVITIIIAILGLLGYQASPQLGGARENLCGTVISNTSTTTSATQNQLVVDRNDKRCNLVLTNDSDTAIYIHRRYFADYSAASTTLMGNKGIRLNANGGSYEISSENLYNGQIWLATTTAGKVLTISELN